jgi:hypothetical protein
MPDLTGVVSEGDAFWRASQENVGPERTAEMQAQMREFTDSELEGVASQYSKMADGIIPIPAGGMMVRDPAGARLAASAFGEEIARRRSMGRLETMRGVGEELDQFSALGREMSDAATQMRAEHPLSGKSDEELASMYDRMQRLREFRETPEHGELWRAHGDVSQISPQFEEMENNILAELARRQSPQSMIAEREVEPGLQSELVFSEEGVGPVVRGQGEVADVEIAEVVREQPAPEPVEKRDFAQEIKDAEAKLAEARSSVTPMQFVPRTMADHRFKIRELGRDLTNAQTPEEKQAVADQLRAAMQDARGAVDVQPKDLMEAITGAAGKRAQKKAFDEMTGAEKAFTKQMHDAAKENRAIAAEERAVAAEEERKLERDFAAELRPIQKRKLKAQTKRLERMARKSARSGDTKSSRVLSDVNNFTKAWLPYSQKTGAFSDEAIQEDAGQSLSPAQIEAIRQQRWQTVSGTMAKATPETLETSALAAGLNTKYRTGVSGTERNLLDAVEDSVEPPDRRPSDAALRMLLDAQYEVDALQALKNEGQFGKGDTSKAEDQAALDAAEKRVGRIKGLYGIDDAAPSGEGISPVAPGGKIPPLNLKEIEKRLDKMNNPKGSAAGTAGLVMQ